MNFSLKYFYVLEAQYQVMTSFFLFPLYITIKLDQILFEFDISYLPSLSLAIKT